MAKPTKSQSWRGPRLRKNDTFDASFECMRIVRKLCLFFWHQSPLADHVAMITRIFKPSPVLAATTPSIPPQHL